MAQTTGSNNLGGLLGGLADFLEDIAGFAGRNLDPDRGRTGDSKDDQSVPDTRLIRVDRLALGDRVMFLDGPWKVVGLNVDQFDKDRVEVVLDNGETYELLAFSYVEVEN